MKYDTATPLGRGATGEVYKAFDPALQRFVALKYLRRDDPVLAETAEWTLNRLQASHETLDSDFFGNEGRKL